MERKKNQQNMTPVDLILMSIEFLLFTAQIVLCIIFFNYFRIYPLMICGWIILLAALFLGWQGRAEFEKKGEQDKGDSWLQTRTVVSGGVYGIVRHPLYLSFALMSLALVLLSQHWINIIMGIIMMALLYNDMFREERGNIRKFGDDYHRYMKQVPRMNILLGIIRIMKDKNKNKD